ncbi:hypothetical protein D3C85_529960 [compost metagenome]
MIQPRHAQRQSSLEEVSRAGLAQIDFNVDGRVGRQCHLHLLGSQPHRCDVAGRPRAGEQLLGFRVRLDGGQHVCRCVVAGGRQHDVEVAVMTARRIACAVLGGVGFAAGQHFFDLAHDDSLKITIS